jgi:aminocarboxymuconate-semialdehyde decarboxylase
MNAPEAAAREVARVAADPRCVGLQIHTNILGEALDHPKFAPIFEAASKAGLAILLHPNRNAAFADYAGEEWSRYEIWQVLGWPYETSVAMARMVLSGMFDRYPGIRVLTHHLGGMIPFFEGRVAWKSLGTRSSREDYTGVLEGLRRKPLDYFRDFYGDTAMTLSRGTFTCGFEFFGAGRVVFATDCPFPNGGTDRMRSILTTLDGMDLDAADRARIMHANALELFSRRPVT